MKFERLELIEVRRLRRQWLQSRKDQTAKHIGACIPSGFSSSCHLFQAWQELVKKHPTLTSLSPKTFIKGTLYVEASSPVILAEMQLFDMQSLLEKVRSHSFFAKIRKIQFSLQ